jgi:hypothetical protein
MSTIGRRTIMAAMAALSALSAATAEGSQHKDADPRPKLVLRAQPSVGISPARVVLTAELVGGADDFEDYYCASIEWEWGDDTKSESNVDCQPYEAGKSEIKRRFTIQHVFTRSGAYKVSIRLKRRERQLATATTNIQIRPGAREF